MPDLSLVVWLAGRRCPGDMMQRIAAIAALGVNVSTSFPASVTTLIEGFSCSTALTITRP